MKALIAWAVCILLVGLIAVGTVRVVSSVASSKKRQFRQDGIEKLVSGDYTGAIEAFDTALEKSGKKSDGFNSDVLGYRAEAEYKLRDYEAAVHTYGLLLEMKPDTAVYLYAQSMCYAHLGDTDNAIDRYHAGNAVQKEDKDEAGRQEALFFRLEASAGGGAHRDSAEREMGGGGMDDVELLARTIQCEAGGEGDNGMKAVASVIMNRVRITYGEYGRLVMTVSQAVYQTGQFNCAATTLGGSYNPQNIYNMRPTQVHYDIANWAIAGNRLTNLGQALWFYNPYSPNCQNNFPSNVGYFVIRIGNHCFYNPTSAYANT